MGIDRLERRSWESETKEPSAGPAAYGETKPRVASPTLLKTDSAGFVADSLRFLLAGGLNTLLTLGLYQLLLFALSPQLAYIISWSAGIIFVITVYPDRVFPGGRSSTKARVKLGLSYISVFLLGLAILDFLGRSGLDARLAILVVTAVTTVTNIVVGRLLLRR